MKRVGVHKHKDLFSCCSCRGTAHGWVGVLPVLSDPAGVRPDYTDIGLGRALLAARSEQGEAAEGGAHAVELTHLGKPRPAHELGKTSLKVIR